MKQLLKVLIILFVVKCTLAQNSNYLDNIDDCIFFKYTVNSMKVLKASGIFVQNSEFVVRANNSNQPAQNVFYQYVEIFNKTKDSLTCKKIRSYCRVKVVPRQHTTSDKDCFKLKDKIERVKNSSLSALESILPFNEYFTEEDQQECERIKKKLVSEDSRAYCEVLDKEPYQELLREVIINVTETWTFYLNTALVLFGLLTNTISLVVFIHSKYPLAKIGNRAQFILFHVSNIVYLLTMWRLNIQEPSSDWFIQTYPMLFSLLNCKLVPYVHVVSFYLSEVAIVSISIRRILDVLFPTKLVLLSLEFPLLFRRLFFGVLLLVMGIPATYLIFSSTVDMGSAISITGKGSWRQYCYIDTQTANISIAIIMFLTLIFSSMTLIVRLVKPTKKQIEIYEDEISVSYVENESSDESKAEFAGSTHTISNVIIVLALGTVLFNTALLFFFAHMSNLTYLYKENKFDQIFVSKEVGTVLLLAKFSFTGLLFIISDKMFSAIMYHWFLEKCFIENKKGIRL